MNVKVTFFFESVQGASRYASSSLGWTETWYGASETLTSLDDWLTAPDVLAYIAGRRPTMPDNYRIAWLRVSDEDNPRSYKIMALSSKWGTAETPDFASTGPGAGSVRGQVQCALLVDIVRLPDSPSDHTHHRKFLMRALPADIINGNVLDVGAANWPAIKNFLDFIAVKESGDVGLFPGVNRTLGLRYQNPATAAYTAAPHLIIEPGDARGIRVDGTLPGTPGVTKYSFKDFADGDRQLNRTWSLRLVTPGPPAYSHLGQTRRALPDATEYTPPGPGKYRVVNYLYRLASQYTIIGLRTKKTGRLFRQLRGRSPNR